MKHMSRIGIIDIGSNSIRLVIYEYSEDSSHRVLGEWKESARLSERIGPDGIMGDKDIASIVPVLTCFRSICETHGVVRVRAVATAAIRNAVNAEDIVAELRKRTNLPITILSGEEEARLGFIGVINTIDVRDGFIVDIGGGSTEVTLFKDRRLVSSVSFPFGSVNTCRRFIPDGTASEERLRAIRSMVETAAAAHPWLSASPGLPLIGLGGTLRSLGKIDQKRRKYSFAQAHNYPVQPDSVNELLALLPPMPLEKRRKFEGLAKDRADIIVPGLVIVQTIFNILQAKQYIISGAGLRDGLFYETAMPRAPIFLDVLSASVRNLLSLHPHIPLDHVRQVEYISLRLFDELQNVHKINPAARRYLSTASLLYPLGTAVHYYQYNRHTFYMMAYSRIDGLSHREILICAMIASYKTKSRTRQMFLTYKDILTESDEALIAKLGSLLQVAIALDKGQTGTVEALSAAADGKFVRIKLRCRKEPHLELKEAASTDKEFQKVWNLHLSFKPELSSKT